MLTKKVAVLIKIIVISRLLINISLSFNLSYFNFSIGEFLTLDFSLSLCDF